MGQKASVPNASGKTVGTALAEVKIGHMRDAHGIIGNGFANNITPVTLVPQRYRSTICGIPCCWVSIPHGFGAQVSRFGAEIAGDEHDGTVSSGFQIFPPWMAVNRLVSRQLIIFDTPVKFCKTSDDVTVNIDVIIVFEITHARDFVFSLGPQKLDDLLRASQEEVLRQLVYETKVENIYDLHGAKTDEFVKLMNEQFNQYGVTIHHFIVEEVQIPEKMAKDFEDTTLYEAKTHERKMKQDYDKMNLNHEEGKQKLNDECDNKKLATEQQNLTAKAQLAKDVREVIASTEKDIAILDAERDAVVADMEAKGDLERAKINMEVLRAKREGQATINAEVEKQGAEASAYERVKNAEGKVGEAEKLALGMKDIAEAEGRATSSFAARRNMEQDMKRLAIIDGISDNRNINIVTSHENNMGLAPDNSLVTQVTQQGMEAIRMKLAEVTAGSAGKLDMGQKNSGGLVRPVPQQQM